MKVPGILLVYYPKDSTNQCFFYEVASNGFCHIHLSKLPLSLTIYSLDVFMGDIYLSRRKCKKILMLHAQLVISDLSHYKSL